MVDLLLALDLRWIVGKVLVEMEDASFVHALVRLHSENEVESIVWVREIEVPCLAVLVKLTQISIDAQLGSSDLLLLWPICVCGSLLLRLL